MLRRYSKIVSIACLVLSVGVTSWSYNIGFERAMQGESMLWWLHILGFILSLALVVVAVVLRALPKK